MQSRLHEVLEGREHNYILPFFWQHGEDEAVLREEMARIYEAGILAVCVEARPHPDYLGPKWWKDMDIIMDEARTRGMRVWALDDDHFPTGHAAGRLKDAPAELRRLFLSEFHIDAIGPKPHSSFAAAPQPYVPGFLEHGGGTLFAVIAVKRDAISGGLTDEAIDLTAEVKDGRLIWDVPAGYWRIFVLTENEKSGDPTKNDYLNPLVAKSVRVLIDTVYEAFYERYRDDFGGTFAGFFSDEPGFYNDRTTFDFNSKLGKKNVALPWSFEMDRFMEAEFGAGYKACLPMLWHEGGERMSQIRYGYMNLVSKLYARNFTDQLGEWCSERGVEYIGHVLEDNNVHARLGSGAGHFFRALGGQHMSGLDVVLWQLNPGFDEIPSAWLAGEADNEFFNYGLAKMASSLAHLDPKKKGRTMAEVFGAYGWAEGLKLMKWMTDHMLVRGVNHFVPHAFSPKEYPDPDCPPHMYARGKNPQFRYYRYLNHYTNRLSHLLSGGTHIATAAVLYHAEAEWAGDYMYFHKPVKELMRNQIDCDIIPCDAIVESVEVQGGKLVSQAEAFDCLIVPYSEALPESVIARLIGFAGQGLPVFFIDGLPTRYCEGGQVGDSLLRLEADKLVESVSLKEIAPRLKAAGFFEIAVKDYQPYLRHYHVRHAELDVYLFFNEHPLHEVDTEVWMPAADKLYLYDAYSNQVISPRLLQAESGARIALKLAPGETIVVVAGAALTGIEAAVPQVSEASILAVEGPWSLSSSISEQYPGFVPQGQLDELLDLSAPERMPTFSGTLRYETGLNWTAETVDQVLIDLGAAFETAEVFVNGHSAGVRLSAPYRFDLTELLSSGRNDLAIEVTNTLVKENMDMMSRIAQQEPSGLLGPVRLLIS